MDEANSHCALCGRATVPTDENNWYEITGWVRGVKKDSLSLRALTGLVAHGSCIDKAKQGIHPDDEAMFPLEDS